MGEEICPECGKKIEFIVASDADSSHVVPMEDMCVCEEHAHSCAAITKRGIWERLNEPLPGLLFILGLLAYGLLMELAF